MSHLEVIIYIYEFYFYNLKEYIKEKYSVDDKFFIKFY